MCLVTHGTATPPMKTTGSHSHIEEQPAESAEYAIDRVIDHDQQENGTNLYCVRWYA